MPDISNYFEDGAPAISNNPASDRSPFKAGEYVMQVVESTAKEKDETQMITFQFEVVSSEFGDEYNGRKHWVDVVMQSPNLSRQQIGHKTLGSLVAACQMDKVTDTDALNGHQVKVTIELGKPKENGGHFLNSFFAAHLTEPEPSAKVEAPANEAEIVDDEIPWAT
ncbi:MAG: hypothetical protein CMQ16_12460 [Gammaproteobacteria bacterium]|nr:hypothetical protein [Gammaproteobacteria bacterium]|tara:strand:+ start:405 stop:902 length:498 start_codon:yes stop_codon:yes gene_type:complete